MSAVEVKQGTYRDFNIYHCPKALIYKFTARIPYQRVQLKARTVTGIRKSIDEWYARNDFYYRNQYRRPMGVGGKRGN